MEKFLDIAQGYDGFLCDLWGVIHDGDHLYPGVLEALEALHHAGKKLVFLSNAPRLAESVAHRMDAMGVKREWYHGAITSGVGAIVYLQEALAEGNHPDKRFQGNYYYMGLEQDATLLPRVVQSRVVSLAQADFILNGNFEFLGQDLPAIMPLLHQAAQQKLPMLCINPDHEVIKLDGTKILCAGFIAEAYAQMGGEVEYVGKPYPLVFEMGLKALGIKDKSRVMMIGDNVLTDIKGASDFGLDCAFVTQGILQNQLQSGQSAMDYCQQHQVKPDFIITHL